jgi:hypothetical protein
LRHSCSSNFSATETPAFRHGEEERPPGMSRGEVWRLPASIRKANLHALQRTPGHRRVPRSEPVFGKVDAALEGNWPSVKDRPQSRVANTCKAPSGATVNSRWTCARGAHGWLSGVPMVGVDDPGERNPWGDCLQAPSFSYGRPDFGPSGRAKTNMVFPRRAFRSQGAPSPAKPAVQPPQPTQTATYWRPSRV